MILKFEADDITEEQLSEILGEDLDNLLTRRVEAKVDYLVKELTEKRFKERIQVQLELLTHPAVCAALKSPEVQRRIDSYAEALVHDVVKKRVLAQTEAWLKTAQDSKHSEEGE